MAALRERALPRGTLLNLVDFLAVRRDGGRHSASDLAEFARLVAQPDGIGDDQVGAWLMAAYLNPLDAAETAALTLGMANSGERLDLSGLPHPWVDKHSTGGVGDKTTLILLPLLAACGLTLVKMSGRGLGITGGTVDKLESIPGFNVALTPAQMKQQAGEIGLALTGQTPNLAPADKRLYAIRDVTGTVASIPLIVSSILSKKLAGGAEKLVLDVKCGSGAFVKTPAEARHLAEALVSVSQEAGLPCVAALTDMDQPLGQAVGNALEVQEAFAVLRGEGPPALAHFCVELARLTLDLAGVMADPAGALAQGQAWEKADLWVRAQAGISAEEALARLSIAPVTEVVRATRGGWIKRMDAQAVGRACVALGGGRQKKTDAIRHDVGLTVHHRVGDRVEAGAPLISIHASEASPALAELRSAVEIVDMEIPATPLMSDVIRPTL